MMLSRRSCATPGRFDLALKRPRASTVVRINSYHGEYEGLEIHHVHKKIPIQAIAFGPPCGSSHHTWHYSGTAETGGDPRGYWSGLYTSLGNKLRGRGKNLPRVEVVSMGHEASIEAWFVRFQNGAYGWGPAVDGGLRALLERDDVKARSVFFGPYRAWLLLLESGGYYENNLPGNLSEACRNANETCGGVQTLAMGPDGEYFMMAQNGTFWRNSLHPSLERVLDSLDDEGKIGWVERVRLGPNGTYCAMFNKYTMWRADEGFTESFLISYHNSLTKK